MCVEYNGSKELFSSEFPLENGTRVRCSPPSVEVGNWVSSLNGCGLVPIIHTRR